MRTVDYARAKEDIELFKIHFRNQKGQSIFKVVLTSVSIQLKFRSIHKFIMYYIIPIGGAITGKRFFFQKISYLRELLIDRS